MTAVLVLVIGAGIVALTVTWSAVTRLSDAAEALERGLRDDRTGALGPSAIQLSMVPELEWARTGGRPVALAVFRTYGEDRDARCAALVDVSRRHEFVYRLDACTSIMLLHDVDGERIDLAIARLTKPLVQGRTRVVDVGVARVGVDGGDVDALIAHALTNLRPAPVDGVESVPEGCRGGATTTSMDVRAGRYAAPAMTIVAFAIANLVYPSVPTPANSLGFLVSAVLLLALAGLSVPLAWWAASETDDTMRAVPVLATTAVVAIAASAVPGLEFLGDMSALLFVFLAGAAASVLVQRLQVLLAILWWGAMTDLWSVYSASGPTKQIIASGGYLDELLFVDLPDVGTYAVAPAMGLVDLFAICAILVMCRRFVIPLSRILAVAVLVIVSVSAIARLVGVDHVPMIPVLAVVMTVAAWPYVSANADWRARIRALRHRAARADG